MYAKCAALKLSELHVCTYKYTWYNVLYLVSQIKASAIQKWQNDI